MSSSPPRERAAASSGGAPPSVPEPRPLAQPAESQLQPTQRPLGLPESGGGEAGMPRPQDSFEPAARPDAQGGTSQPGVAACSRVVADPRTITGAEIAQQVGDSGAQRPRADPQTTINVPVGQSHGGSPNITEPLQPAVKERTESLQSIPPELEYEIQRLNLSFSNIKII